MIVKAYGAYATDKPLETRDITRRTSRAHDVRIDIAFCGICHSDLPRTCAKWASTQWSCVPDHKIVGRLSVAGAEVKSFCEGDLVGIVSDIEMIHVDGTHEPYEGMLKGDIKYRFVIDNASLAA